MPNGLKHVALLLIQWAYRALAARSAGCKCNTVLAQSPTDTINTA